MQISLDTASAGTDELTALIALCASLGGRLPATGHHAVIDIDEDTTWAEINQGRKGPPIPEMPAEVIGTTATPIREVGLIEATAAGLGERQQNVDSKGTPWDARIHSESRATVADGSWRKRRGVDDAVFAGVMAELAAAQADGTYFPPESDDAPPPPPAESEGTEVPLAPPADEQVPAPPVLTEPSVAANAPVAGDGQFASFADFVAAVSKHGKTYQELNDLAGMVGIAAFKDLKDHADKWDMFVAMI